MTILHRREELHLIRKTWHAGSGSVLFWLAFYSGIPRMNFLVLLVVLLLADLCLEWSRLNSKRLNREVSRYAGALMRERELATFSGIPYYLSGILIAMLILPEPVSILAVSFLIWGDPAASFAGILWGKKGPRISRNKTLIGTGAGVLVCFVATILLVRHSPFFPETSFEKQMLFSLLGGGIGGSVELLPLRIDDNLLIPVFSGLGLWPVYILIF